MQTCQIFGIVKRQPAAGMRRTAMNVVIALLIVIVLAAILIPMTGVRRKNETSEQNEMCKQNDEGVLMV